MERTLITRRPAVALAALLALGTLAAAPAMAQQSGEAGGRFRVLVPNLERQGDAKKDFGEDVAEEVRKLIDGMPTHAPVEKGEVRSALRKFKLKEDELDCIKSRQLAVQINAELVMCGTYTPTAGGFEVSASFISARSGESFEVPAFRSGEPKAAAQEIYGAFEQYVNQLRLTTFCVQYLGSQQWQNALENCDKALAINPQSQTALYAKARALMELDSLEESLEIHKRILELNPVHQDALLTGGVVAARLDDQDLSRSYFHQYLELNPGDPNVRLKVATDLAKAGDPAGALGLVEEGIAIDSANVDLLNYAGHFALAAAQEAQAAPPAGGNGTEASGPTANEYFERALRYYRKVFEAKGAESDATMLKNMVLALNQLQRYDEAVEMGARVVQAKPEDAGLWAVYADALQKAGRLDEALAALDSVTSRDSAYPNVSAKRGSWYLDAGRIADAKAALENAVAKGEIGGDDAANLLFAFGYNDRYKKGQTDGALNLFALSREFAASQEVKAQAAFWSAFILFTQGIKVQEASTAASARQALPMFQRALELFQQSGAYRQQASKIPQLIDQTRTYIEIQEALIKRGR